MGVTHTTPEQLAKLYAQRSKATAMLRRLEWCLGGDECPICGASERGLGHGPGSKYAQARDCELAALLQELP
jgi:hypothetical protein